MGEIGASFEDGIIELDENSFDEAQEKELSDEDPTFGRFHITKDK